MKRIVIWLLNALDHLSPKQDKAVLRGLPDVEDQCLSVLMGLARRGYPGTVVWLMRSPPPRLEALVEQYGLQALRLRVCRTSRFAAVYHFMTARWVFFTHGTYSQGDWGNYTPPRGKTIVNLWHGMPIKAIWRFLPGAPEAPRADVLLATSPRFQQIMAEASGMKTDQIWICGLPRNDLLHYRSDAAEKAITELAGPGPWFLYLPTYRKSREGYLTEDGCEHDTILSMSDQELEALERWLGEQGITMIVKAHPISIHAGLSHEQKTDHVVVIGESWLVEHQLTLYGLASYSSGLITDLSSIAVDYLLLDRPVFIYFPDRDAYVRGRGTVFEDLERNLPAAPCPDVAALIEAMAAFQGGEDPSREKRARLLEEWHSVPAEGAADRLLDALDLPSRP